jgi:hypothetical protein
MDDKKLEKLAEAVNNLPIKEVYNDLLSPGFKKSGEALGTLMEFGTIPVLPIKLLNAKAKYYFEKHIDRYEKKLKEVKSEPVIEVPEYVGLPILEKFTYLNDEYLSEAFINLLVKASFNSSVGLAHPKFLSILDTLSSDEAKILAHISSKERIPFIDIIMERIPVQPIRLNHISQEEYKKVYDIAHAISQKIDNYSNITAAFNLTIFEKEIKLQFPDKIQLYLENLEFNGLIKFYRDYSFESEKKEYLKMENAIYKDTINDYKKIAEEITEEVQNGYAQRIEVKRGFFEFTEIGRQFVKACIKDIEVS